MRSFAAACLAAATLALPTGAGARPPAVDYTLHCQGCHLSDGRETPGRVPALAGALARFARVPEGRRYLARVPGVAQAPLDDAALAALLNWVLWRFDPEGIPADFRPYSAGEVGRLRRRPLSDLEGARRRLVEQTSPALRP